MTPRLEGRENGSSGPRRPPLYPVGLAIAYVAMLFITAGSSPFAALRLFGVTVAVAVALCLLGPRLVGDRDRGAMLALAAIVLLLLGRTPIQVVLVALLGLVVLLDARLGRHRRTDPWPRITLVASRVTAIVLLAVGIRAMQEGTLASIAHDLVAEGPLRPAVASAAPAQQQPDIYLVLLDGYARADTLDSLFGYDNSAFLGALDARGFEVADQSRSNYIATELSLSSLFNLSLLDRDSGDPGLARLVRIRRLVNDAAAWPFLRANGYETIAVASGFETVALRSVDRVVDTGQLNELEVAALRTTGVGAFLTAAAPDAVAQQHRDRVRGVLASTAELAREAHSRPRFVFAHVPSPHAPAVFDERGGSVPSSDLATFYDESAPARGLTPEQYGRLYTAQLGHVNRLALQAVDAILAASPEPPVIVLFADHGSAARLDWGDLDHSDLHERTAVLFATLTPGQGDLFGEAPTVVNILPTLFNAYLGGTFPRQADTSFRWRDDEFNLEPIDLPDD